jgi:phosphoribosylformimino-5-aminoimidazole carboxamide ribonucleotide (ProFAR) isomerase
MRRLQQGDMNASTTFGEDPAAMARRWLDAGARRLHLVDLNGAFAGKPVNEGAIKAILKEVGTRSLCSWAAASATWTPSSATSMTA